MLRECYRLTTHSCHFTFCWRQYPKVKVFLILQDSSCVLCSRRRCLHHVPLISTQDTFTDSHTHAHTFFLSVCTKSKHLQTFDKRAVSGTGCWFLFHAHHFSCWSFSLAVLVVCDSGEIWACSHCTMGNENSSAVLPVRTRMLAGPAFLSCIVFSSAVGGQQQTVLF